MTDTRLTGLLLKGVAASRPAANAVGGGTLYSATDTGAITQSDGVSTWSAWATVAGGSGSITASGYTQTTARLLGRTTAATGAIEEITVGSGLSLAAGALTATGGAAAFVGCKAYHSTTEALATGASRALLLDSEIVDTNAFHFLSAAALTGTVSKTAASPNIVGVGTAFTTELSVNQVIKIPGTADEIGVVKTITDNLNLVLWQNMANTASGQTATRQNQYIAIPVGYAGKYRVQAGTYYGSYTGTSPMYVSAQQNGADVAGGTTQRAGLAGYFPGPSPVVVAAEGDYFSCWSLSQSSASENVGHASAAGARTMLSVEFLGT